MKIEIDWMLNLRQTLALGILIGAAAAVTGKRIHRPVLKGLIKLGLATSEAARDAASECAEVVKDLAAEARIELDQARAATAARATVDPNA